MTIGLKVLVFAGLLAATCQGFKSVPLNSRVRLQRNFVQPSGTSRGSLSQPIANAKQPILSPSALQAASTVESTSAKPLDQFKGLLYKGGLFGVWYFLNIYYNIYNKKILNRVPELTWTVGFMQLFLGLFYVIPIWVLGIRKTPKLSKDEVKNLLPVAICHTLTHIGAVVSFSAGAISFTHIVKAAEPAVSAGLTAAFDKVFLPLPVYLSLVPVMGGVALASASELSFTWLSFGSAMVSNVASAARGIVGKKSMGKPQGENMNAMNLYAVMTILATILLFPFSMALEATKIVPSVQRLISTGVAKPAATEMLLSGVFYYLYNEVAFLTLDAVAPVTHALGNTIKRVVIILTSVVVFGTKMTKTGALGSSIAIFGVLLYSLAKAKFK